jgi:hypothetical protein
MKHSIKEHSKKDVQWGYKTTVVPSYTCTNKALPQPNLRKATRETHSDGGNKNKMDVYCSIWNLQSLAHGLVSGLLQKLKKHIYIIYIYL